MDSKTKLEESRKRLEKLKRQREERQLQRQNQQRNEQTEQYEEIEEVEEEIQVQITTTTMPTLLQKKTAPVYFTKSTNTNDLETLTAIQNDEEVPQEIDLDKIRKQMELEIRAQLDLEYQQSYSRLLSNKNKAIEEGSKIIEEFKPKSFHQSVIDNLSKLTYPSTPAKCISHIHNNRIVTLHNNYLICVWELELQPTLIHSIKSTAAMSIVQLTSKNDIIAGSNLGKLYLYTYDAELKVYLLSGESSQSLQCLILDIYPTLDTFVLVTQKGEITIIASNLNDILTPKRLLKEHLTLTQVEFIDSSRALLGNVTGDVYIVDLGTLEINQIYESNNVLPVISMKYKSTLISGLVAISNLDNSIHVVDVNSKQVLEIPLSSFVIDLDWKNDHLVAAYLSADEQSKWETWSINDNQMSFTHLETSESELVSRIKVFQDFILAFNPKGNPIIIHL